MLCIERLAICLIRQKIIFKCYQFRLVSRAELKFCSTSGSPRPDKAYKYISRRERRPPSRCGGRTDKGSGNSVFLENLWSDLTRNASNQSAVLQSASGRDKVAYERALPSPETNRVTESAGKAQRSGPFFSFSFLPSPPLASFFFDSPRNYSVGRSDSDPRGRNERSRLAY